MKVFAISDLHLSINNPKPMNIFGEVWDNYLGEIEKSWNDSVSQDDAVLIAGDISWAMKMNEVVPDLEYISGFKGHKIIIRGNHDYWWSSISALRSILPEGMYALQNDALKLGDTVFCGSRGWMSPDDCETDADKKIYARELIRMRMSLENAKKLAAEKDRLIVMVHYPPFNVRLENSPMTDLFEEYGAEAVVYGHLHGRNARLVPEFEKNGIKYYLTSCDMVSNRLVRII